MIRFKKVSKSGSVTLPLDMRRDFNIQPGDSFEIEVTGNGGLLMKRHVAHCIFCESDTEVSMHKGKPVCEACRCEIKEAASLPCKETALLSRREG